MKHPYLTLVFALLLTLPLHAQMEVGQWAPPFTLTDINGNQQRLYDFLAEGKPVIIDLAAAWCPPCWAEHESGILKEIWEQYGPDGTDEVMILFIEADPTTDHEQLIGVSGSTMGNWVEGTPYPIIDVPDYGIPRAYRLQVYPTILLICPDMRVKVPQMWTGPANWTKEYLMSELMACGSVSPPATDAGLFSYDFNKSDCYLGAINVGLFNSGSNPLTSAEVLVKRNGEQVSSFSWTGELAFGEEASIAITDIPLDAGENDFTVELASEDDDNTNNAIEIPFIKAPQSSRNLTVYVQTDENTEAENTRWHIEDENGAIVAESGPLANLDYSETAVTLEADGCYTMVMADDGGDGLTGGGFILVSDDNENLVFEGSTFGIRDEIRSLFLAQATSQARELTGAVSASVFPNPALGQISVKLELDESSAVSMEWLSVTGESLGVQDFGQLPAGLHNLQLSTAALQPGIYYLAVHSDSGKLVKKVVKL
ncbi:MAG: redoxin domain-containing protein [Phaeodactylibacter sp.]|nr:redoxin domain-containing protein [Phaeodactylibacter sp.]MCB9274791.1 redoxin domain-containing protein [Lewinellaceae bacterium]